MPDPANTAVPLTTSPNDGDNRVYTVDPGTHYILQNYLRGFFEGYTSLPPSNNGAAQLYVSSDACQGRGCNWWLTCSLRNKISRWLWENFLSSFAKTFLSMQIGCFSLGEGATSIFLQQRYPSFDSAFRHLRSENQWRKPCCGARRRSIRPAEDSRQCGD